MEKFDFQKKYPNIFSPMTVRGVTFKNRVFVGPIGSFLATHEISGHLDYWWAIKHWGRWAQGGFAACTLPFEAPANSAHPRSMVIDDLDMLAQMDTQRFNHFAHAYGMVTSASYYHPGCCQIPSYKGDIISADSFIYNGRQVRAMTYKDMEDILELYVNTAKAIKVGGFDMLNLHYAHGWLMNNFLSPLSNHRTDEFGGSVENRCRFPKMVLDAVREVVGDMPIELRLNGSDGDDASGISAEDAAQQCLILGETADMIHMTCGTRLDASSRPEQFPSHFLPPAHNAPAALAAKKAGVKCKIGIVGNVHDPELIEQLLADGTADYILMVRQANADPDYMNKLKEGREEDIRPCLHCNLCIDGGRRKALSKEVDLDPAATYEQFCAINPYFGHGNVREFFQKPSRSKNVIVVGGGLAGMLSATWAARNGHKVTLYEKSDKLGGLLFNAEDMWFKDRIQRYHEYVVRQLMKSGAEVVLNTEVTPEMVRMQNADCAIIAIGSESIKPNIKGIDGPNVVMAEDILGNKDKLGKKLLIIGGGLVGCELSIELGDLGHEVTLVEMGDFLAANGQLCERTHTLKYMDKAHVKAYTETQCVEITEQGAYVEDINGKRFIEADNVIICVGFKAKVAQRDAFANCAFEVKNVGDCKKAANIHNAVTSAFDAAMTL